MLPVGFEPTIAVFEREKTLGASEHEAAVIGTVFFTEFNNKIIANEVHIVVATVYASVVPLHRFTRLP
jgi:hypothetical protein